MPAIPQSCWTKLHVYARSVIERYGPPKAEPSATDPSLQAARRFCAERHFYTAETGGHLFGGLLKRLGITPKHTDEARRVAAVIAGSRA